MDKWELAYKDYKAGMKYREIAEKYEVSINTVKSWKSRKWADATSDKKVAHKKKRLHTKQEKVAHKKNVPQLTPHENVQDVTDILSYYGITEQQRRFADNFIETSNIYRSAINADYSHNYANARAYELLGIVGIKKYIDDRMKVLVHGQIATQEEVLQHLTNVMFRREEEHQVVTLRSKEEKWVPTGEDGQLKKTTVETEEAKVVPMPTKVNDSNKAAELLGKRYALWTDKVDLQSGDIVIKVGEWDADEET